MIGTVVGSYRISSKLSVGGMGTIYAAEHVLIGKPAAVKILHPELSANQDIAGRGPGREMGRLACALAIASSLASVALAQPTNDSGKDAAKALLQSGVRLLDAKCTSTWCRGCRHAGDQRHTCRRAGVSRRQ